ncbi:MAG: T9SS type A sorting domain-containing protein [Chlorobi bacterium]|nr:T9SS type A sorting domain-containing protein [Chlorobiota bacterium]MCI0715409.1 T9SS type A sorting domain-containing protein [Chlorobiota bacterium]
MKNSIFLLVLLLLASSINIINSQWVLMSNGLGSQATNELAANVNTIFAGGAGAYGGYGVFLSTNNGVNWIQTSQNWGSISAFAVNGNNIFAGIWTHVSMGVYRSTDNGGSWTYSGLQSAGILSLAFVDSIVLTGTGNGTFISTNNGINWVQTNSGGPSSLAVRGNYIFGGGVNGVWLSTNYGVNWNYLGLGNQAVRSLALNTNNVFAGTANWMYPTGVYLSTNNGTTWTSTSLNNRNVFAIAVSGYYVFGGTYNYGVYASTNNGANWVQWNVGLGDLTINALCTFNGFVFAATNYGVYRRPLSELTGIKSVSNQIPNEFSLYQNYPNPFNPVTKIRFELPVGATRRVSLTVYDALGREIASLVNDELNPGTYEVDWDASNYPPGGGQVPSGVYFYKLVAGDFTQTKKMILLK